MDANVLVELRGSSSAPLSLTLNGPDFVDMGASGPTVTASLYKDLPKLSDLLNEHLVEPIVPKAPVSVS